MLCLLWGPALTTVHDHWKDQVLCLVAQSCPTLCDRMDCSPPGSSVHGILQARILEWVAMPSPRGSSQPKDRTQVSCIAGRFFTIWATKEAKEYWNGSPIPSPGDLPDPGKEPGSPALQVNSLPTELSEKPSLRVSVYKRADCPKEKYLKLRACNEN